MPSLKLCNANFRSNLTAIFSQESLLIAPDSPVTRQTVFYCLYRWLIGLHNGQTKRNNGPLMKIRRFADVQTSLIRGEAALRSPSTFAVHSRTSRLAASAAEFSLRSSLIAYSFCFQMANYHNAASLHAAGNDML